jgi:NTE family protein
MIKMNITLALSGGGVKGFAHIGVLRALEWEGFHIRGVAGTSAGGLVGVLYALGYTPDDMEKRLKDTDQGNLFSRMSGDGPALLGVAGLTAILHELIGERTFTDLRFPLALTATDLTSGLPVVIREGRLMDAVLATSAVPGVFPARSVGRHLLVDGGILNPIPVEVARSLDPSSPVVAILLSPPPGWQKDVMNGSSGNIPHLFANLPLVYRLAGRLRLAQALNIFLNSVDLAGLKLVDMQLQLEKPEVIIRPRLGQIGIIDRVDIPELINSGEEAAKSALSDIHRATSWQNRLARRVSQISSRS